MLVTLPHFMALASLVLLLWAVRLGIESLIDFDDLKAATRKFAWSLALFCASGLSLGYWAAQCVL